MTIFSIAALIAIKKYNMLDYSPRHQWNAIIESMNEGVLIVNNKGQIKYANKKFCEITGYEFGEMEGKIACELFLNNDEQKEYICKVMKNRNKKLSNQYEMQLKTKSGEKVWMLINGFPYMDINGNVIGSIGIHTNINHLKETETRLIDKMNELKIFFYKASHDLRSPATTIQGLINLHKSGKEKNIETLFSFIEKSNYQSLMIVDEISLIASILQHDIEATETDLECEIKKIIQQINPCDSSFEFEINVDMDTNFSTDKEMLTIILRNIFDNAIKYRDLKKQLCLAKIYCYRKNNNVEIKITDNGQGIPEKMQDKIFDLFSKSTTSSLGLGLYIAKCAAEKLDGSITMKSKERQGTEFTICIPNKN